MNHPEARRQGDAGEPILWGRSTFVSAGVAVAVLGSMIALIDVRAVWQELLRCHKGLAVLGLLAHYATYWVRGVRWRRVLRHLHRRVGYGRFGLLVFFYNFVDNLVPAKLGDLYGAHLARINLDVSRPAALGSIVFLRMVDAWVVVVLGALSASLMFSEALPTAVTWALLLGIVIAVGATMLLVTFFVLNKVPSKRLPEALRARLAAFQTGMWPRNRELGTIALLTALIWALETVWILLLVMAFGMQPGLTEVLFLTMIPLLASAFPLTPSGVGAVELSLYGCLRAVGAPATLAASITVLNRFIDYWLHIVLGFAVWAIRGRLGLRTWREVPLEKQGELAPERAEKAKVWEPSVRT